VLERGRVTDQTDFANVSIVDLHSGHMRDVNMTTIDKTHDTV